MILQGPLWEAQEERLVRYLLGTLPPEEEAALEERLFEERDLHQDLRATTDDLIRAYLVGRLPADDRARFESHFLASPRRRARFAFMKGLLATSQELSAARRAARSTRIATWLATAAVLLASIGVYVAFRPSPRGERRAAQPETPSPTPVATATDPPATAPSPGPTAPPRARPVRSDVRVARLPAAPEAAVAVALAEETRTLRLEVPIEGSPHPTYRAELRDAEGAPVWQAKGILPRAPGAPLVLDVPARVLVAAAYELHVTGDRLRDAPSGPALSRTYSLRITR